MKIFREYSDEIFEDLKRRNTSDKIAKDVIRLDRKWRKLIEKGNQLRAKRNEASRGIGKLKKEGKTDDSISQIKNSVNFINQELSHNEQKTEEVLRKRNKLIQLQNSTSIQKMIQKSLQIS